MPESLSDPPADPQAPPGCRARLLRSERLLLSLIALLAAARVLLLSAVFPLFNNVDE